MIIALITKETASEISVRIEKNYFSVNGGIDKDISYKLILNNSEDKDIKGTIKVEGAKPYDTETPNPSSTIIAEFGRDSEKKFEISANSEIEIYLSVNIKKYAPGGTYYFPLKMIIEDTEEMLEKKLAILTVESFYKFEIYLEDKYARKSIHQGDRVDFEITIENKGNVEDEIKFKIIDYPSIEWEENISFSDNPLKVPIQKSDDDKNNIITINLIAIIPDLNLDYEEIIQVEFEFYAESNNGEKKDEKIKLQIKGPPPRITQPPPPEPEWYNKLPFPREFVLLFPIFAMVGGSIVIYSTRKREYEEDIPTWEEWEENGNGKEKEPTITCPECDASMKISSDKKQKSIICYECKNKINIEDNIEKTLLQSENEEEEKSLKKETEEKTSLKKPVKEEIKSSKTKDKTINCPKCKIKLKVTSVNRPLTFHCPKCNAKIVLKAKNEPEKKTTEPKISQKTIKCPKCKIKLKIASKKTPQSIHCPKCNVKIVLKEKEQITKQQKQTSQKPKGAVKATTIKCPKCKASLKITNQKRSLTIYCPKCKSKIVLKGKESETKRQKRTSQKPKRTIKPTTIKCPKCKTSLKIINQKRPLTIACPKCKSKLRLK